MEKWGSILIAFLDNYGYSLILHQHSECGGFLKVSCNMESQMIFVCFLCSITWKPTDLSCTLKGSFTHMWFCKSHVGLSKHICSLTRSCDRWHILLYNMEKIYITFMNIATLSILGSCEAKGGRYNLQNCTFCQKP